MEKSLKNVFTVHCTHILKVIIYFPLVSQAFVNKIPVSPNFLLLHTKYLQILIPVRLLKHAEFFLTFLRRLTGSGMKVYSLSSNHLALLNLIASFLSNRFQRVVLNGRCSTWKEVLAGVPQGSILGPLLFLVFINDLPEGLRSNIKIFADDTSLFSKIKNTFLSSNILNSDLRLIADWADQWKMSFNPDPSKQAIEVIFSKKNY